MDTDITSTDSTPDFDSMMYAYKLSVYYRDLTIEGDHLALGVVTQIRGLNVDDVYPLVLESEKEGFRFVRRFYDEYVGGTNRFDRAGEALFVAHQLNQIVGICGLNHDPYTQSGTVGRVRRLYVHPDFRKHGVGRRLLSNVIMEARRFYTTLTLRTDNPVADQSTKR